MARDGGARSRSRRAAPRPSKGMRSSVSPRCPGPVTSGPCRGRSPARRRAVQDHPTGPVRLGHPALHAHRGSASSVIAGAARPGNGPLAAGPADGARAVCLRKRNRRHSRRVLSPGSRSTPNQSRSPARRSERPDSGTEVAAGTRSRCPEGVREGCGTPPGTGALKAVRTRRAATPGLDLSAS